MMCVTHTWMVSTSRGQHCLVYGALLQIIEFINAICACSGLVAAICGCFSPYNDGSD